MRVKVLGSGTSSGVPVIGCQCSVCTSPDPKNHRTRASVAIELAQGTILIDTATDLRQQALRWGLDRVDAVLFTHAHADHIHGIDELRIFNIRQLIEIPCYATLDVIQRLQNYLQYILCPENASNSFRPHLELLPLEGEFELLGKTIIPVPVFHGEMPIVGYRIGGFAYLTDVSHIPEDSWALLHDLDLLLLDALRIKPHPTHYSLDQALEVVEKIQPKRTALTHISHMIDHADINRKLPLGVELAYDGMLFEMHCRHAKPCSRVSQTHLPVFAGIDLMR